MSWTTSRSFTGLARLLRSGRGVVRRRQHPPRRRRQRHPDRRWRQRHHRRRRLAACRADQLLGWRADHPPDPSRIRTATPTRGRSRSSSTTPQLRISWDANGLINAAQFALDFPVVGHVNAANVDTAVYNGPSSNYGITGPDGEGFLTITQLGPNPAIVGGNPQGLLGGADDTDRIRHIERLQFSDVTVAIDKFGNQISTSAVHVTDPTQVANYETGLRQVLRRGPVRHADVDRDGRRRQCRGSDGGRGGRRYAARQRVPDLRPRQPDGRERQRHRGGHRCHRERPVPVAVPRCAVRPVDRLRRRHHPEPSGHQLPGHRLARRPAEGQLCGRQGLSPRRCSRRRRSTR